MTQAAAKADKAREAMSRLADYSAEQLSRRLIESRAFEAVVWGMPAVNFELLYQGLRHAGGSPNQILYWSRLPDWRLQTLTPNMDVIYFYPFIDTRSTGPMVLEIPPAQDGSLTGSIDDGWQVALEDVGPAGLDKGMGGKYLILPPGYDDRPPSGYIALPSQTYRSYAILRSNLASGSETDVARAVAYGKRVKLYPLAQAANPPQSVFVDAAGDIYYNTIPYGLKFFELLHRFVQHEPWLERDRLMIEWLVTVGIEKGRAFSPDSEAQRILEAAALQARDWLAARYETCFHDPYFAGTGWAVPAAPAVVRGMQTNFADREIYPVDDRGVLYSMAYFSAKQLGRGQFYVMAIHDHQGEALEGARTYRLRVPPHVPVDLYWSATVYDRATHAPIRNLRHASRASNTPGLKMNADGSADIWFAPTAPAGQESNWIPTRPQGWFEILFRFYGPRPPLFEKSWTLPDIEMVA